MKPLDDASIRYQLPITANGLTRTNRTQLAFWIANGLVDVVTQLLVGLTPIYLLMNLQLSAANKRLAMAAFAPNITYGSSLNSMSSHTYMLQNNPPRNPTRLLPQQKLPLP